MTHFERIQIYFLWNVTYKLLIILNNDSFESPVVGRTGSFFGAEIRLLLNFPEIILMSLNAKVDVSDNEFEQKLR